MKTRVFLVGALSCLLLGHSLTVAFAAPEQKIDFKIKDETLPNALQRLADSTGLRYRLPAGLPNIRLNLEIRQVGAEALLRLLLRQASTSLKDQALTWSREGEVYVIQLGPAPKEEAPVPAGAPELPRELVESPKFTSKLTFAVKNESLERVVGRIFADTGLRYRVQPELSKLPVTLSVRDVPAVVVARLVLQQVSDKQPGVGIWQDGRTYVLGVKNRDGRLPGQP